MTFKVYALFATDEPLQVRYVGATKRSLAHRLRAHISQYCNPAKRQWIKAVIARGAAVDIRLLSEHITAPEVAEAEGQWRSFWASYCDLLNGNSACYT